MTEEDVHEQGRMLVADRRATVTWQGSLTRGSGSISTGSGALTDAAVTWASRIERSDGKTSPEELLAAAQAECYAMVLTNKLSEAGNEPESLEVTAVCTVEMQNGGLKITTMRIHVHGHVAGVDPEEFNRLAQESEESCPVSNALRGNVDIQVEAELHAH
jgi:osmotically inducible protein OsmC